MKPSFYDLSFVDNQADRHSYFMPDDVMESRLAAERIRSALETLDPRRREALLAVAGLHPSGKSVRQLSTEWRVSRQRCYQIANSAKRSLHQLLRDLDPASD